MAIIKRLSKIKILLSSRPIMKAALDNKDVTRYIENVIGEKTLRKV